LPRLTPINGIRDYGQEGKKKNRMKFGDFENLKEERICQECYGYEKGGSEFSSAAPIVNPISLYFSMLDRYTATAGKAALSTYFWLMFLPLVSRNMLAGANLPLALRLYQNAISADTATGQSR
jgi:hypothetical protein